MRHAASMDSPVGPLVLVSDGTALTAVLFADRLEAERLEGPLVDDAAAAPFARAKRELTAYSAGRGRTFTVPLAPRGTPFQHKVWRSPRLP